MENSGYFSHHLVTLATVLNFIVVSGLRLKNNLPIRSHCSQLYFYDRLVREVGVGVSSNWWAVNGPRECVCEFRAFRREGVRERERERERER